MKCIKADLYAQELDMKTTHSSKFFILVILRDKLTNRTDSEFMYTTQCIFV